MADSLRETERQAIHRIYDDQSCPRNDGGRLHCEDGGSHMADDPNDSMASRYHFVCTVCGHWWKPIELRRRTPAVGVLRAVSRRTP